MNDKIKTTHLERCAYVYVRQSTAAQVHYNKESTDRQYKLTERALRLGWPQPQIKIVDEDLARSGSGTTDRHGFAMMTAEVALGHVGLILSIEVLLAAAEKSQKWRRCPPSISNLDIGIHGRRFFQSAEVFIPA
jgi:hypothetical protein